MDWRASQEGVETQVGGDSRGVYTPLLDSYPYLVGGIIRDGGVDSEAIAILGIWVHDIGSFERVEAVPTQQLFVGDGRGLFLVAGRRDLWRQVCRNLLQLLQGGTEVFDDLPGDLVWRR